MRNRSIITGAIIVIAIAAAIWVVAEVSTGWADTLVFIVIVLTAFGAAIALYPRRYTLRRRTFVRQSEPTKHKPTR